MEPPPPRLHVVLRPDAPAALVIRQGPTRAFCTIGWELARDRFVVGQWVRHKLYPERGDISPDGAWHVYFALDGHWSSETMGAWTGLAKVPYLKCARLWPQGHTWGGGGMIVRASDAPEALPAPPLPAPYRIVAGSPRRRLQRDGWRGDDGLEKAFGAWILRKRLPGMGFVEEHELVAPGGIIHERRAWQWADVDAARGRVVFAEAGRLCAVPVTDPLRPPEVVFDANGMTFEAIPAPY